MASCKRQDELVKLDILTILMHHKFNTRDNLLIHATMTSNMYLTHLQDKLNGDQDSSKIIYPSLLPHGFCIERWMHVDKTKLRGDDVQDGQVIDSSMLEFQATNIKTLRKHLNVKPSL